MLPPKTERGRRTIVLDQDTVDVLRAHRGSQLVKVVELDGAYSDQGYVFPNQIGGPLDPYVLTDAWRKLTARAGMSNVRLHDLRHFHASTLLQANTHPKVVQERLGHSTISITLDTYSHTVPSLQEQAVLDFARVMKANTKSG